MDGTKNAPGNEPNFSHTARIIDRNHFRLLYEGLLSAMVASGVMMRAEQIGAAIADQFGPENVRWDAHPPRTAPLIFRYANAMALTYLRFRNPRS